MVAGRYAEIANTRRVGGQWEVFQASDLDRGGRHVAVKVVPSKSDEIFRIYFERETAAMRTLSHVNVAALLDSGIDDEAGLYYVVLEWIPDTLKTWLAGLPETPGWDDVADTVALPLASARTAVHRGGACSDQAADRRRWPRWTAGSLRPRAATLASQAW